MSYLFKQFLVISLLIYSAFGFSNELIFHKYGYPNKAEAEKLMAHDREVSLSVCCYYPDIYDYVQLKKINLKQLKITAGYFPTKAEMDVLDRLKANVIIEVSEVYPNSMDHRIVNESNLSQLIINSYDFPTHSEVMTYNQFKKNVRLNITRREYPLPKHMKHIKKLKEDFTVGFYNPVPPGPGYANFFNDLKTNKVFVIVDKFPYGMDAVGINMLEKSQIEIRPDERLMPQDVKIMNEIKIETLVVLHDQLPIDEDFLSSLVSIEGKKIILEDNGSGELLKPHYQDIFSTSSSEINLFFEQIL